MGTLSEDKLNMTEDNEIEACRKLYGQYTELVNKTQRYMQTPGRKVDPKYVKPEDRDRKEEIRLQLLDCKECLKLSPREWFEIEKR